MEFQAPASASYSASYSASDSDSAKVEVGHGYMSYNVWRKQMNRNNSLVLFAPIPDMYSKKCDDLWDWRGNFKAPIERDMRYVWREKDGRYRYYFLWGANEDNVYATLDKKLNGSGMASKDGPTCGLAKPNYIGILTVNRETRLDRLQAINKNQFRKLKIHLSKGSIIVFPVYPVKNTTLYEFSLGSGEARKDADWYFIQKNIMENIIKLIMETGVQLDIPKRHSLYWQGQSPQKKRIYIESVQDLKDIVNYIQDQLTQRRIPRQRQQPRRRRYLSPDRAIQYQNRRLAPRNHPYENRRLQDEVRRLKTKNEEYSERIPKYKEKELREKISNLEKKVNERKTPSEYKELENRAKRYKEQVESIQYKLNKCRRDKGESTDVVALKAKVDEYKRKLGEKQGNPAEAEKKLKEFEKRLKQVQTKEVGASPSTGNKEYDKLLLTFQKEQHKYKKCSKDHDKCLQEIRKAKNSLEDWTKDMNLFISHFEECIQRNPDPSEKKHIAKIRKSEKEVRAQIMRLEKTI